MAKKPRESSSADSESDNDETQTFSKFVSSTVPVFKGGNGTMWPLKPDQKKRRNRSNKSESHTDSSSESDDEDSMKKEFKPALSNRFSREESESSNSENENKSALEKSKPLERLTQKPQNKISSKTTPKNEQKRNIISQSKDFSEEDSSENSCDEKKTDKKGHPIQALKKEQSSSEYDSSNSEEEDSDMEKTVPDPIKIKEEHGPSKINVIQQFIITPKVQPKNWTDKFELYYPNTKKLNFISDLIESDSEDITDLLLIPKTVDPKIFENLKWSKTHESKIQIGDDSDEYLIKTLNKEPEPSVIVAKTPLLVKFENTYVVEKSIYTNPDAHIPLQKRRSIPLPEKLKVRHPLFGSQFKNKVILNDEIQQKLHDVGNKSRNREEKERRKEERRRKKLQEEKELEHKQDELIFSMLNSRGSISFNKSNKNYSHETEEKVKIKEEMLFDHNVSEKSKSKKKKKHKHDSTSELATDSECILNGILEQTIETTINGKKSKKSASQSMNININGFKDSHKIKSQLNNTHTDSNKKNKSLHGDWDQTNHSPNVQNKHKSKKKDLIDSIMSDLMNESLVSGTPCSKTESHKKKKKETLQTMDVSETNDHLTGKTSKLNLETPKSEIKKKRIKKNDLINTILASYKSGDSTFNETIDNSPKQETKRKKRKHDQIDDSFGEINDTNKNEPTKKRKKHNSIINSTLKGDISRIATEFDADLSQITPETGDTAEDLVSSILSEVKSTIKKKRKSRHFDDEMNSVIQKIKKESS